MVCDDILFTNDVAQLYPDHSFVILGRKDNIINSGGIKIQIEILEELLKSSITIPFAITSVPDAKLGQAVALLLKEGAGIEKVEEKICAVLPKYQQPRKILFIPEIPLTGNGKIDRSQCRLLAEKMIQ